MSLAHLFAPPPIPLVPATARVHRIDEGAYEDDETDEDERAIDRVRNRGRRPAKLKVKELSPPKSARGRKNYANRQVRLDRMPGILREPMSSIQARQLLGGIGRSQFFRDIHELARTMLVMLFNRSSM